MSDGDRSVESAVEKVTMGEAFGIIVGLAAGAALTEAMAEFEPERLGPQRAREIKAFDMVHEFLADHLEGDCGQCV